jgi:hypothetical protein
MPIQKHCVILYTYIYIFTIPYLFYFQNQDVNFVPEDDCILLLSCIDDLLFDENELWPLDLKPGRFSLKLEQICTFKCTCCLLRYAQTGKIGTPNNVKIFCITTTKRHGIEQRSAKVSYARGKKTLVLIIIC